MPSDHNKTPFWDFEFRIIMAVVLVKGVMIVGLKAAKKIQCIGIYGRN